MADLDRSIFEKRIGEIALGLGLITPEAQSQMIELHTRTIALVSKGANVTTQDVKDDARWAQLQQQYAITPDEVAQARQMASGPHTISLAGVTPSGQLMTELNGGLDPEVKDALLAAQASEKALQALHRAQNPGAAYDDNRYQSLVKQIGEEEFVHLGREGERSIVKNAQQVWKTAREFEALEHHVDCPTQSQTDPELNQLRAMLANTLPQQAATTYRMAAMTLGVRAAELASINDPRAAKLAEVADAMVNMLANQLNVPPPTEQELAAFAAARTPQATNQEITDAAKTATNTNETTKSWVEKTNRGGASQAQVSASV